MHPRDESPKRRMELATLIGRLDAGSRDRIIEFLFPPHLGPNDVQHYCNMRLVTSAWTAIMDSPCPDCIGTRCRCSHFAVRWGQLNPFGPNTIPLLRMTKTVTPVTKWDSYCSHFWWFGRGVHHPTAIAIQRHHNARTHYVMPLGEKWRRGNHIKTFERTLTGVKLPSSSIRWLDELHFVSTELNTRDALAVIYELDEDPHQ